MKALLLTVALTASLPVGAATVTSTLTWDIANGLVPDNDDRGWTDRRTVSSTLTQIDHLEVFLTIEGGWNGDLFAYVRHNSGFSVLLNRVGSIQADGAGSSLSGFNVTFSDQATHDIHTAGIFTGTFLPDARLTDPDSVTDLSPRTEFLSSFNGQNPDGAWTLFVADMAAQDQSRVTSWGIRFSMEVPEPASAAAVGLPLLLAGGVLLRRRRESH